MSKIQVKQLNVDVDMSLVMCCRACLATDCKLYNMHEHNLVTEFLRVSGFDVNNTFPHYLCVWCTSLVRRCAAFRDKCRRATNCLLSQSTNGILTINSISVIDRCANQLVNLVQTEVEITDSLDTPSFLQKQCLIPNDTLIQLDGIKTNNALKNNLHDIETEAVKENETPIDGKKIIDTDDTSMHGEIIIETDDTSMHGEIIIETDDVAIHEDTIIKSDEDVLITEYIANNHDYDKNPDVKKSVNSVCELSNSEATVKRKRKTNLLKLKEFEKTYNVDLVVLTKAEQLAEIEARRATDGYKKSLYRCHPCGKNFRRQETLDSHKVKHTEEAGKFECPICTIRFANNRVLHKHTMQLHHCKIVCRDCGFVTRERARATIHYKWHGGKAFKCDYCENVYHKPTTLLSHIRILHPTMNTVCNMCGETFIKDRGLKTHKKLVHRVPGNEKLLQCELCSVTFISLDALENHKDTADDHADLKPCIQCGESFDSEKKMQDHAVSEHPNCDECQMTFVNKEAYETHVRRKHLGSGRPGDKPAAAAAAGGRRVRRRGVRGVRVRRPQRSEDIQWQCCEQCGKMFRCESLLRIHQKVAHEGIKPFTCNFCEKSFNHRQVLKYHLVTHTGEGLYQCPQCPRTFSNKYNGDRHYKTRHLNIRDQCPCPLCDRVLSTRSSVRQHIKEVHCGERKKRIRKTKDAKKSKRQKSPSPSPSSSSSLEE